MAEERFDLSYRGDLAPETDPARVRERLTALFKLSEAGAERLFTGRPVIVKRNADAATTARFTEVFGQAGALLTVTPLDTPLSTEAQLRTSGDPPGAVSASHRPPTPAAGLIRRQRHPAPLAGHDPRRLSRTLTHG